MHDVGLIPVLAVREALVVFFGMYGIWLIPVLGDEEEALSDTHAQ